MSFQELENGCSLDLINNKVAQYVNFLNGILKIGGQDSKINNFVLIII